TTRSVRVMPQALWLAWSWMACTSPTGSGGGGGANVLGRPAAYPDDWRVRSSLAAGLERTMRGSWRVSRVRWPQVGRVPAAGKWLGGVSAAGPVGRLAYGR